MSILEKLGLEQKKQKGSPNIGKKKQQKQQEAKAKKVKYLRALIFSVFLITILIMLPQSTFQPVASYSVGEPWRGDDLTAPFTFSLQKSAAELEQERDEIRRNTPPVFHVDPTIEVAIESNLESINRSLQPVFDSYEQWQRAKMGNEPSAPNDSVRFMQERNYAGLEFSEETWQVILEDYRAKRIERQTNQELLASQIQSTVNGVTGHLLEMGILDRLKDEIDQDEITIRNLMQRTERTIDIGRTFDLEEAVQFAETQISANLSAEAAGAAVQLFSQVIEPNFIYHEEDTEALLAERLENISTTKGAVEEGEIIIRKGDIVNQDRANKLNSLAEARAVSATDYEIGIRYLGDSIIIIAAALLFLLYLYLYRIHIFNTPPLFLLVFLVMGMFILASAGVQHFDAANPYLVPIAVAPIILTIIFDSRVGLMAVISMGMITGIIHDNNFEYLIATITACSFGVFSVRDIKKRSQFFFFTPGVVLASYLVILGAFALTRIAGWEPVLENVIYVMINSVFILFTYPLILLIERLFKITTDFTLLELADTNLPLMKKLMNDAPGTFHHSLQVANLAESAASEVGANALLCRVGAMYHDIGKMEKPGYFIENQSKSNDHDKLKPRMSAMVIKAHVSDGLTIADEYHLPQLIKDFIRTHHGTSLIKYFYGKAKSGEENVPEEDFRYDGPIPFTKEQGILMLADSVEAASRSMKDPTYNKLENLINRIVDDQIQDGQLSDCPLTFKQIQTIKTSFLNILVGVYHSRIEYPDDKKDSKTENKPKQADREKPGSNDYPGSEVTPAEQGKDVSDQDRSS